MIKNSFEGIINKSGFLLCIGWSPSQLIMGGRQYHPGHKQTTIHFAHINLWNKLSLRLQTATLLTVFSIWGCVNSLVCSTCIIFFHIISWKGPEKSVNSVWILTVSRAANGFQWMALWKKHFMFLRSFFNWIFKSILTKQLWVTYSLKISARLCWKKKNQTNKTKKPDKQKQKAQFDYYWTHSISFLK